MTRLATPALLILVAACNPTLVDSADPADSATPSDSAAPQDGVREADADPALGQLSGAPDLAGDDGSDAPPADADAPPSVSGSATIIRGLTCGLMHTLSYSSASCEGYRTSTYSSFTESVGSSTETFYRKSTGDWGASSGDGFYHMSAGSNVNVSSSSTVALPKGTTCGLGHSKNYTSAYCYSTSTLSGCPTGWTWRYAYDTSSSGGYWFWCEYQDPYSKCSSSSCYGSSSYVPQGTTCGLGHNDYYYGTCAGKTISSSSSCPTGWTYRGWYDRGASSGHGMGWCEKS